MYNYWVTALTEQIALAPKAPLVADAASIAQYKKIWEESNRRNLAYLPYDSFDQQNQRALPAPARPPGVDGSTIQAMVIAIRQSDNDLKATTGFYDASLGERGPEQSGTAILARQQQGQIGSVHYQDNLNRAIRAIGRILIRAIPKVWDTTRVVRVLGPDEQSRPAIVYAGAQNAPPNPQQAFQQAGMNPEALASQKRKGMYDLGAGTYDVVVSVGPQFGTQRQETVAMLQPMIQAFPPPFNMLAAMYAVKNMDMPGAAEFVKSLQKGLPPQLQPTPEGQVEIPPQAQQQMQEMNQVIEAMTQQMNALSGDLEGKKQDLSVKTAIADADRESREWIEALRVQTQRDIAGLQTTAQGIKHSLDLMMAERELRQQQVQFEAEPASPPSPATPAQET
ncbi:MAG: hypothetical protein MUQ56_06705, partial [Thermoleophilia bacterium]|nr:hypothetical protein [Thermoleophilia bacterium]